MGTSQLHGLVVAVTGGAAGIGREIAADLGIRGYPLDVTDEAS